MMPKTESIRGLTLWQPMAWAIAAGHKRIENRPWKPWRNVSHLAIHAGAKYHRAHAEQIAAIGIEVPDRGDLVFGAIIAVVPLRGHVHVDAVGVPDHYRDNPWFSGPYAWLLGDVVKLDEPIARRGAQGLWNLDPHELDALYEQGAISHWRERG